MDLSKSYDPVPSTKYKVRLKSSIIYRTVRPQPYVKINTMSIQTTRVTIWDTYVTRTDGGTMHFDIIAPNSITDPATIHGFGREYLRQKGQAGQPLTARECRLCHTETLRPEWEAAISERGYFILEMEDCH